VLVDLVMSRHATIDDHLLLRPSPQRRITLSLSLLLGIAAPGKSMLHVDSTI
jgi:hypothetical protein